MVYALKVFPYKVTDAGVLGMCFVRAVRLFISCWWAFDWRIVEKGDGNVRDLVL
jgi:hypothetical protein